LPNDTPILSFCFITPIGLIMNDKASRELLVALLTSFVFARLAVEPARLKQICASEVPGVISSMC
jgi:hypothetical protein